MNDLKARVHELYWKKDCNCAKTMLLCLCEHFCIPLQEQTLHAATGMHGAGRFRAQCGLVEGALMFIGIAGAACGLSNKETTARFGSLACRDLRPGGFQPSDPPHACEALTGEAVAFAVEHLKDLPLR